MGGAKRSTWIGGTVFVALVIVAAAYLLAISPMLTQASESRAEAESTRQQNEILQMKVAKLAADFGKLDSYKGELASMRVQIPTTAELSSLLRQIDAVAVAHGVTVTAISPGTPEAVAEPPAPVATDAPTDAGASAADAGDDAPDSEQAPEVVQAVSSLLSGFVALPVSITALGTYEDVLSFIGDLQEATPRLFLVSGLTGAAQKRSDEGGGRPATEVGDLEVTISGYAFTLLDPYAAPADVVDPAPALPGVVVGKNPLIPLGGE